MARLMDKDELVANFRKTQMTEAIPEWKNLSFSSKEAVIKYVVKVREMILEFPTVNAVPVVRCADCVMYDPVTRFCHYHGQEFDGGKSWTQFRPDDFCSYGERRCEE